MTHELLSLELSKKRTAREAQRGEAATVAGNTDLLHASFAERRNQLQVGCSFPNEVPLMELKLLMASLPLLLPNKAPLLESEVSA